MSKCLWIIIHNFLPLLFLYKQSRCSGLLEIWNMKLKQGYSSRNFRLLFWKSMVVIQTLFTNLTHLCHICWLVCSQAVTYDWFPVIWGTSWWVPHVGQEMLTLSRTPDFTPFNFTHSLSKIYTIHVYYLSVSGLCIRINDSVYFAWISLTACLVFVYGLMTLFILPGLVRLLVSDLFYSCDKPGIPIYTR